MPWTEFKLNDGHKIPGVGFGSSGHPLEKTADDINLAIECGFDHIDTAQSRSQSRSHAISRYPSQWDKDRELTNSLQE